MDLCRRHDCAHDGVCEACNLQERLTEAENDLQATRADLIKAERDCEGYERDIANLEEKVDQLKFENSRLSAAVENHDNQ